MKSPNKKLPRFESEDQSLADALNLLADAIDGSNRGTGLNVSNGKGSLSWDATGTVLRLPKGAPSDIVIPPWQALLTTDENGENTKVWFWLGSVNGVVPTNMQDEHAVSGEDVRFFVLTVTTSGGKVTSALLSLDSNPPATDSIAKDAPPTSFKIVLGMIKNFVPHMCVRDHIQAEGVEVFRESRSGMGKGEEAFSRWWRWRVSNYGYGAQ
jgi:hypothetical protein